MYRICNAIIVESASAAGQLVVPGSFGPASSSGGCRHALPFAGRQPFGRDLSSV
jgi:hypothetical protein